MRSELNSPRRRWCGLDDERIAATTAFPRCCGRKRYGRRSAKLPLAIPLLGDADARHNVRYGINSHLAERPLSAAFSGRSARGWYAYRSSDETRRKEAK